MAWTLSGFTDEAGDSIQTQIQACKNARMTHLDLRSVEGFNIAELPEEKAREIKKQLDDAGISVYMFGSPIGKIDIADNFATDLGRLEHLGKLAPIFGCNRVRIFSYFNKKDAPMDQWRSETISRLSQLKARAKELGLVLFHENEKHIYGDLCERVLHIAELRDSGEDGNFRLIFDFDNYNQCGENVWDNWQKLKSLTDAFHLKDSDKENRHVPIGQGNGHATEILGDAQKRGWQGPLSLEPHLKRSQAVMATGPHGQANQDFASLGAEQCFTVAADTAHELFAKIGAEVK